MRPRRPPRAAEAAAGSGEGFGVRTLLWCSYGCLLKRFPLLGFSGVFRAGRSMVNLDSIAVPNLRLACAHGCSAARAVCCSTSRQRQTQRQGCSGGAFEKLRDLASPGRRVAREPCLVGGRVVTAGSRHPAGRRCCTETVWLSQALAPPQAAGVGHLWVLLGSSVGACGGTWPLGCTHASHGQGRLLGAC